MIKKVKKFDKKDDVLDKNLDELLRVNPEDIEALKAESDKRKNIIINLLDGYYGIWPLWFFIFLGFLLLLHASSYAPLLIKQFIIVPFVVIPYTFAAIIALWNSANRERNLALSFSKAVYYIISTLLVSIFVILNTV